MKSSRAISKLFTLLAVSMAAALSWLSLRTPPAKPSVETAAPKVPSAQEASKRGDAYQQAMDEAEKAREEMVRIVSETKIQNRCQVRELSQALLQGSIEFTPANHFPSKMPQPFLDPDEVWHRQMQAATAMLREQRMPWR